MIGNKIKFNFDAARFDKELTLDELRDRNRKQVMAQIEGQKLLQSNLDKTIQESVGQSVLDAVSEPFNKIKTGLTQLGGEFGIADPRNNPIAGAINLATGISEIPMLIGTVPLNAISTGLDKVGLDMITKPVNKTFETVAKAPQSIAEGITTALEESGTATKIRDFVDNVAGQEVRIPQEIGQPIKQAVNDMTGLASIVGLSMLAGGVYKGFKENIQVQNGLKDLGYTKDQITKMQPEEAHKILQDYLDKTNTELMQKKDALNQQINNEVTQKPIEQTNTQQVGQTLEINKPFYEDTTNAPKVADKISKGEELNTNDLQFQKNFPDLVEQELNKMKETQNATEKGNVKENDIKQYQKVDERGQETTSSSSDSNVNGAQNQPLEGQNNLVDNNVSAIQRLTEQNKSPEEISTALNIPVEDVNKVIQKSSSPITQPQEIKPTEEPLVKEAPTKLSDIPPDNVINNELINSNKSPEDISITKQSMNDLRERIGLPELEKTAQQNIPDTFEKVKTEIDNGARNEDTLLRQIESGNKQLDPKQSFELAYYLTKESNKWNVTFDKIKEAQKSGDAPTEVLLRSIADDSLAKIKRISDVASSVTSEWGRFGRFMQVQLAQDYSIARTMQRAELYAPDGKIPETAKSKLETLSSDIVKLQDALKQYQTKNPNKTVEDFISRAQRDYQFEQRRTKRAVTKEELHTERQQLWTDLYKQTSVAAAGIPLTPEAIRTMGKLATNYVKEGIVTVEGLVDEFHKGFQGKISKEDIMKALSGYGKESSMTKNETLAKLNSAKKEMRLLLALEDAQKGVEPFKRTVTKPEINPRVQNLQRQLKSYTRETVTDATKLQTQKTRVQNNISNYEQMLREGRFEKKQRTPLTPDKELTDLKAKEHQLKKQVELELYKIKRLGMTKWEHAKEIGADIANIPRTLLATADLSMPLRQGLTLSSAYPKLAYDAFKEMHKAAISDNYFKQRMTEIETSPNARVYEKMGIDFTGVGSDLVQLAKREESFISAHILNKVPGLKQITQFSERGAVSYLNVLRQDVADWQIKLMMQKGMTPENSPKVYQDVGKLINWGTGRADLGWMERAPGVLNAVMFSPRNFVAKLHLMNPLEYVKLEPQARKLLMRQQVATLAQGITFLNLMKLNGASVETNPRSADFAKAKFGNTRIDMFGGFQQNFVLLARLAYGQVKSTNGRTYDLNGKQFPFSTRLDLATRFMRSKASPQATIAIDALAGKDVMGNEFGQDMKQEVINRFLPMVWQDMIDAQKEIGWGALGTTLLGFYGAGTQTYKLKEKNSLQPIKFNFDVKFNFK
jgi:hypothetical protein